MIDSIANLYKSEDLSGEFLCQPLKFYHNFFVKKIENCEGDPLKRCAWIVAHKATGIFAYPLFTALAFFGLLIKLTGVQSIKSHNNSQISCVEGIGVGVTNTEVYSKDFSHELEKPGRKMKIIREFKMTKYNVDSLVFEITDEISSQFRKFRKVYVSANGTIENDIGEISIQLSVFKP